MKNYKLILTDMDGTVLGEDHRMTDGNKKALKEAEKNGVKVVFATGRFHDSAKEHIDFLENIMPIISSNGSIIKHPITNEVLYSNFIDKEVSIEIVEILEKHNVKYQAYTDEIILQKYETEDEMRMMKEFIEKTFSDKTEISFKKDLREDIRNSNVLKFNIMEIDRPDLIDKVRVDLELVKNIEVTSSWKDNLEVMSEGSHKGNAVEYLCELLDIDREHIIAFGDNYNDLSMIEFAGTGVAMGNAEDDVKKIANHITDSNGNDGVAKAIYDLVLQKVVSE